MKAIALIEKLNSDRGKHIIVRNLSRIMDIRILDIDLENKTVSFVYDSSIAIDKVERELCRIGYPLNRLIQKEPQDALYI